MNLLKLMAKQNITPTRLAKASTVPYATISDLCNGKTQLEKCSAITLYKLAKALNVTMEDLIELNTKKDKEERSAFDWFRSNVQHTLKDKGDISFIRDMLVSDKIREYYNKDWYRESLYLLAMLDYLSREHGLPKCRKYNDLRSKKLANPVFPLSVTIAADLTHDDSYKESSIQKAIPEFMRHNIVEGEIRNVF